jgi:hypothetical protein
VRGPETAFAMVLWLLVGLCLGYEHHEWLKPYMETRVGCG